MRMNISILNNKATINEIKKEISDCIKNNNGKVDTNHLGHNQSSNERALNFKDSIPKQAEEDKI